MGKATNARRKALVPAIERLDGPTPEQMAKGGYAREDWIHGDLAQRVSTHVNRGGTPVMRWARDGKLSDTQMRAIDYCLRLWRLAGIKQKLTANYGERLPCSSADADIRATTQIEAREDLWRIIDYFPGPLRTYWQVFELVCRDGLSAGTAGEEFGYSSRSNEARAHKTVCFVADYIAMKENL